MPIAMMVDNPGGSQEVDDRVRELLGLEAAGAPPPPAPEFRPVHGLLGAR